MLAGKLFLDRENRRAVYVMFYIALCRELIARGLKRLQEIITKSPTLKHICNFCLMVHEVAEAQSRSKMINKLHQINVGRRDLGHNLLDLHKEDTRGQKEALLYSLSGA